MRTTATTNFIFMIQNFEEELRKLLLLPHNSREVKLLTFNLIFQLQHIVRLTRIKENRRASFSRNNGFTTSILYLNVKYLRNLFILWLK